MSAEPTLSDIVERLRECPWYEAQRGDRVLEVAEARTAMLDAANEIVRLRDALSSKDAQIEALDVECQASMRIIAEERARADLADSRLAKAREGALEEAIEAQPSTAEDPNESAYERGRFDGVMSYANVLVALRASQALPPKGDDR